MNNHKLLPPQFPEPWATAWGEDSYGIFQDIEIMGINQRFRWCEPGRFLMGSPKDEPEREYLSNETLHEVILTKGFWLSDSTVTQALWLSVMKENPSRFHGENRPVEQVRWSDVQKFIARLYKKVPELSLRLPWEAEWEYACRAGTITPFSFGKAIAPDKVNYDGEVPYNKGEKDFFRKETVEVKSLPCNDWGFYEMHGNVWEWCEDFWEGDLGEKSVIDPKRLTRGPYRIIRGGSWSCSGGPGRSAIRSGGGALDRIDGQGFRLAWSH